MGGHDDTAYQVSAQFNDQPELAICLVSGGMDSCVTAALAHRDVSRLAFLHISYGQRTELRELQAFEDLAKHYGVKQRLVVSLVHLAQIGGSS
jgi:7-cyano-7-deazaguanine synthase